MFDCNAGVKHANCIRVLLRREKQASLTYKSYQDFGLCDRICFHQLGQNCFFSTLQCLVLPAQKYERFSWLCFSDTTLNRKVSLLHCLFFMFGENAFRVCC